VQMFHSYQMDWETFALVGRTFSEVFPQSGSYDHLSYRPGFIRPENDYCLSGFKGEREFNRSAAGHRPMAGNQTKFHLSNPELPYRLIVSEETPHAVRCGTAPHDNRPLLSLRLRGPHVHHDPAIEKNLSSRQLR